jgi:hypothetical protein
MTVGAIRNDHAWCESTVAEQWNTRPARPDSKVIAEADAAIEPLIGITEDHIKTGKVKSKTAIKATIMLVKHITSLLALCRSQAEERGDIAVMDLKAKLEIFEAPRNHTDYFAWEREMDNLKAKLADSQAQIDRFWEAVYHGYLIETREEIEKECKESWAEGTSPLEVAAHYMWKREPKVEELQAQIKSFDETHKANDLILAGCGVGEAGLFG